MRRAKSPRPAGMWPPSVVSQIAASSYPRVGSTQEFSSVGLPGSDIGPGGVERSHLPGCIPDITGAGMVWCRL